MQTTNFSGAISIEGKWKDREEGSELTKLKREKFSASYLFHVG